MEAKRILNYLSDIAANNNRPWFLENKAEYDVCRKSFNDGIAKAINRIAEFDDEVAHLQVKDCVYRFNRDTRFSPDKSPYKRHLEREEIAARRLLYPFGTRKLPSRNG